MSIFAPCACLVHEEVRRGHGIPGMHILDGYKPPCGCWVLVNLSPLRGQGVPMNSEPSPQPQDFFL